MRGVPSNFPTESNYIFFKDFWSEAEATSGLKPGTENKKKICRAAHQEVYSF